MWREKTNEEKREDKEFNRLMEIQKEANEEIHKKLLNGYNTWKEEREE
jgi:hypothetical protein